jgi:leucyl aminopeptidase (aminopeptidase T)
MADFISYLAWRAVQGVGVQPGELVVVMDHAGRDDLLRKVLLNVELAGATPLPEIAPPDHLAKVLYAAEPEHLAQIDKHRQTWMQQCDRIIVLTGGWLDLKEVPAENIQAWSEAQARLSEIEEAKLTPNIVVAAPNETKAQQLGMTLDQLEATLHDPIVAPLMDLQNAALRIQHRLEGNAFVIRTGNGCELRMQHGSRLVLMDDGYIDDTDRERGAVVSNLPAGSVYTTVLEASVEGALFLPQAGDARDVILHFDEGCVAGIEAASGAHQIEAMFDAHTGESRRIGHIGIGANPHLRKPIGWTLVDEHVWGALFIAFGENRYMGGQNDSSLNEDFALHDASLEIDGVPLLKEGRVIL